MILSCPSCSQKLRVPDDALRIAGRPIVTCVSCNSDLKIKPNKAKCGSCKGTIKFFPFMINPIKPIAWCPHCDTPNRFNLNRIT